MRFCTRFGTRLKRGAPNGSAIPVDYCPSGAGGPRRWRRSTSMPSRTCRFIWPLIGAISATTATTPRGRTRRTARPEPRTWHHVLDTLYCDVPPEHDRHILGDRGVGESVEVVW